MYVLAEIRLFGEAPVPWSAPRSFKGRTPRGKTQWVHDKNKRLIAWQDSVRAAHRRQYGGEPYRGPVDLLMVFHRGTSDETLWGTRWWSPKRGVFPDLMNLAKGTEDALTTFRATKGAKADRKVLFEIPGVFEDDSQTCQILTRKEWAAEDGVSITVYALED